MIFLVCYKEDRKFVSCTDAPSSFLALELVISNIIYISLIRNVLEAKEIENQLHFIYVKFSFTCAVITIIKMLFIVCICPYSLLKHLKSTLPIVYKTES